MIVANHLRRTLLEPLKERQRMEGYREGLAIWRAEGRKIARAGMIETARAEGLAIGRAEGIAIGRKIGRAEWLAEEREQALKLGSDMVDAAWTAWNARRERAAARGEPFDEPTPSLASPSALARMIELAKSESGNESDWSGDAPF